MIVWASSLDRPSQKSAELCRRRREAEAEDGVSGAPVYTDESRDFILDGDEVRVSLESDVRLLEFGLRVLEVVCLEDLLDESL